MLITPGYKEQITQLHSNNADWGISGKKFAGVVQTIVGNYCPLNILDYGCGKQTLARALPQYRIRGYDPGLPGLDDVPEPHDMVICTDVLEHIEPECIEAVLDDLQRVTLKTLFVQIPTEAAKHKLPDGRNAHLIIKPDRWWMQKLWSRFDLASFEGGEYGFQAIFAAMKKQPHHTRTNHQTLVRTVGGTAFDLDGAGIYPAVHDCFNDVSIPNPKGNGRS